MHEDWAARSGTVAEPLTLRTLLATYPNTRALKRGDIQSPIVRFDFADVRVANSAFKSLVRDRTFDLGELAIVTYLQARTYGTPYVLLPIVVVGRSQQQAILYNEKHGRLTPGDLAGLRVGVRTYSQTTGVWLRGMLEEDYGVDFRRVRWVAFEDAHVSEYRDPAWVERAPAGKELLPMLLDGELDAAIFGNELPDEPLTPLIPDADAAAARWAEQHGGTPPNHMLVIRESIAKDRSDIVREVYRLLLESTSADATGSSTPIRFGVEPNRRSLEVLIDYSLRQGLIPRPFTVDELFDDTARALGIA